MGPTLSLLTDVWGPHVRVVFNLPPHLSHFSLPQLPLPLLLIDLARSSPAKTAAIFALGSSFLQFCPVVFINKLYSVILTATSSK